MCGDNGEPTSAVAGSDWQKTRVQCQTFTCKPITSRTLHHLSPVHYEMIFPYILCCSKSFMPCVCADWSRGATQNTKKSSVITANISHSSFNPSIPSRNSSMSSDSLGLPSSINRQFSCNQISAKSTLYHSAVTFQILIQINSFN